MRFLLTTFIAFAAFNCSADQHSLISKEEGERAVAYLEIQDELILFCGCCSNDTITKLHIDSVWYKHHPRYSGYSAWVRGRNSTSGEIIEKRFDLAYAWVKVGEVARCLAWELDLYATTCGSEGFTWDSYSPVYYTLPTANQTDADAFEKNYRIIKKSFESMKPFRAPLVQSDDTVFVKKVRVEKDFDSRSVRITYSGKDFETTYVISLVKLITSEMRETGLYFRYKENGSMIFEERVTNKFMYRDMNFQGTLPLPEKCRDVSKEFLVLARSFGSMSLLKE